ncbi:MAG: homoserine dehydrogenase [Capsulimonadaceae bacterium]
MQKIGGALLGYGAVGSEVFQFAKSLPGFEFTRVLDKDMDRIQESATDEHLIGALTTDFQSILDDDTIRIVVELTGSARAHALFILPALAKGKHVVTANKKVLAQNWTTILCAADDNRALVKYDAAVGGGIPIVRVLQEHSSRDKIRRVVGILNGTSNYILTRMRNEWQSTGKTSLKDALELAQRYKYAEPDPSDDIDGSDIMFKITILANLAFGSEFSVKDVHRQGIRDSLDELGIVAADFDFASRYPGTKSKHSFNIKLLGIAEQDPDGSVTIRVHPCVIPSEHFLSVTHGAFNGIVIEGDRFHTQFFFGEGAGPAPTSVSIAAGIQDCVTAVRTGAAPRNVAVDSHPVCRRFAERSSAGFIRSYSPDIPGVFVGKLNALRDCGLNIQSVQNFDAQHFPEYVELDDGLQWMPDYIVFDSVEESKVENALSQLRGLNGVRNVKYFRRYDPPCTE